MISFGPGRTAQAHTFAIDRNITVLLHTNPDDDPIVNQPAAVLFQITDSTGKFDSSKCDCAVEISKQKRILFTGKLLRIVGASVYDLTMPFTFPDRAVYQITVTGSPETPGLFQSFKVEYDLRVDRQDANSPGSTNKFLIWWLVDGVITVAVGVYTVIYFRK